MPKGNRKGEIKLEDIAWDPAIYPRKKWSTKTIERYAEAMNAGEEFPDMILEEESNRLLDGKHRYEAYKAKANGKPVKVFVEWHEIPEDVSARLYAASLSVRHGDRISNPDLKIIAEEEFDADPSLDVAAWASRVALDKSTVYRWVSHIIERERRRRQAAVWRLSTLGWTQHEIAELFGVAQKTISVDIQNSHLRKMYKSLPKEWNTKLIADEADRLGLPHTDAMAAAIQNKDDKGRLEELDIKTQPYDVWHFNGCHGLMGDKHPGRIPGELICHVLHFFTKPGDLVVDPMAGSGTTLDACLLMGRKARGYDIDLHHERVDIQKWELNEENGWPPKTDKADLVFWDPPYFDKKDDEYVDGSISRKSRQEYLDFFESSFTSLYEVSKKDITLAFLMSDWDDPSDVANSIFVWDYVSLLQTAGWQVVRHIQTPLSTQQIHPDIVNKKRESRQLCRLGRSLLICRAASA